VQSFYEKQKISISFKVKNKNLHIKKLIEKENNINGKKIYN
jgi:hypothetical protein